MKNTIIAILFLGSAAFLLYALYDRFLSNESSIEEEALEQVVALSFPDDVEIERKDGSRLKVRLTGRNATHVQFERLSDDMFFTFEISQLDTPSQKLILDYPEEGFVEITKSKLQEGTTEYIHVEQLKEQIAKIDQELRDLKIKFAATESISLHRRMQHEADTLFKKRLKITSEIAERTGLPMENSEPLILGKEDR